MLRGHRRSRYRERPRWPKLESMNVDQALDRLLERAGSDLLISSGSRPRIRKDGKLEALEGDVAVLTPEDTDRMVRDVLDAEQLKELEEKRHVDFSFTWRDRARI